MAYNDVNKNARVLFEQKMELFWRNHKDFQHSPLFRLIRCTQLYLLTVIQQVTASDWNFASSRALTLTASSDFGYLIFRKCIGVIVTK